MEWRLWHFAVRGPDGPLSRCSPDSARVGFAVEPALHQDFWTSAFNQLTVESAARRRAEDGPADAWSGSTARYATSVPATAGPGVHLHLRVRSAILRPE